MNIEQSLPLPTVDFYSVPFTCDDDHLVYWCMSHDWAHYAKFALDKFGNYVLHVWDKAGERESFYSREQLYCWAGY